MLKDSQEATNVFLDRVKLFGEKLGPLLLQFPPSFGREYLPVLTGFLSELPNGHRFVVEVRNQSLLNEALYDVLRGNNVALAWVDSPIMPQTHEVTADFIYVRWEETGKKSRAL